MTISRANAFRDYLNTWVKDLRTLYPHTREGRPRPNIHAAGHIYDFLLLFGPVLSWWCFPFERLIGALQKINTNDHIGGAMESAIMKSVARTANLRHWLRRPACPEAVRQLKVLFDKCFVPANAPSQTNEFVAMKGVRRAYAKHDGVNFSGSSTHAGNASIIYRPIPDHAPIAGQIQWIESKGDTVRLHVRPYQQLSKALYDPFLKYPHFSATTYSSVLGEKEDVINLDDIISHAARYDYSYGRSVLVNLSRQ
ncbi:hypothetical protein BT96DRAFT_993174 [Gymnopus androsaceus JB14]|uniref:Uncharacterized protein n=2 Tax=Gymnopus androsaceus JB14 TaxID=1447944 RepID=A0A6A4HQQ7_9AGAR|nr:hypothetical protein BT96DRAFT_837443 [Gymnopus androsaceus JB14]KAE9400323.1 hypothetical protein BT96DRAFT_993174 [Gymnopus androsaceus JB14]